MKAAVFTYRDGLKITDYELGKIEDSQVLVRIRSAGLCASDIHYMDGRYKYAIEPIIPGHEGSGVIEELGRNVDYFNVGDEVIIDYVWSCGRCKYCLEGRDNLCKNVKCYGFEMNGTFAEYIIVDSRNLVLKPKHISFDEAAILGCAVVTPYHAIKNVGGVMNKSIAIVGLGGVGIHLVLLSKLMGAKIVIGIDVDERKYAFARRYGLDHFINPLIEDPVKRVREITTDGVDISFEFVGSLETMKTAVEITRPGGTILIGGLIHGSVSLNLESILSLEKRILTTMDHTHKDLIEITEFINAREIRLSNSITHKFKLDDIHKAIELFKQRSEPIVRIVLNP